MAGLLVPMGTLADRIGNRTVLLIGLVIFGLASVLAAFSESAAMLIAARVLLALGGAMIVPCVLGSIRAFEDDAERATALGVRGAVGAAGAAVGPLVGGLLLEHFWWGSVFLINVPVTLLVAPAYYLLLPRSEATTKGHWPAGQALLLIVGMIALVYAIKPGFGGKEALGLVLAIGLAGVVLLALFVQKQVRSDQPMLDLSLFSHPAVIAGIVMAVVLWRRDWAWSATNKEISGTTVDQTRPCTTIRSSTIPLGLPTLAQGTFLSNLERLEKIFRRQA